MLEVTEYEYMTVRHGVEGFWDNVGVAFCASDGCGWFHPLAADFRVNARLTALAEQHDADHPDHDVRTLFREDLPGDMVAGLEDGVFPGEISPESIIPLLTGDPVNLGLR